MYFLVYQTLPASLPACLPASLPASRKTALSVWAPLGVVNSRVLAVIMFLKLRFCFLLVSLLKKYLKFKLFLFSSNAFHFIQAIQNAHFIIKDTILLT